VAELPMSYGNNYHQVSEQRLCPLLPSLTAGGGFVCNNWIAQLLQKMRQFDLNGV